MNDLLFFASEIKEAAIQLKAEAEAPVEEEVVDKKDEEKVNKELQTYATFIRKFLQIKGNDKIFAKLLPLLENPRNKKPRNSILQTLEKSEPTTMTKDSAEIIMDLKRILMRYNKVAERYPAVKLIKEILNFGVANGVPAFKRLLSIERKLYNSFSTQSEK